MIYFIIKEHHYSNIENSYDIVASSKDIDIINIEIDTFIGENQPSFSSGCPLSDRKSLIPKLIEHFINKTV